MPAASAQPPAAPSGAPSIAVLGAGSWGSALAMQLSRNRVKCVLWGRDPRQLATMRRTRSNERYLPGISFPPELGFAADLAAAVESQDEVLLAVPSHAFVGTLSAIRSVLSPGQGVAWACKGLEPGSGRFLHEAAAVVLGDSRPMAVVTGPSFAVEVARDLPTAVTVAGTDGAFSSRIARALHGGSFRAYTSDDIIGAELGGAVKNVLAIAAGISDGMGYGDNARAALLTRGLAEMMRLGRALGARDHTLTGLAGMGDLVLTSTGDQSRNRRLGLALGRGQHISEAVGQIGQVVEGVSTSEEVWRMASRHAVEMPISEQVHGVIHRGWDPKACVRDLLSREQKSEAS